MYWNIYNNYINMLSCQKLFTSKLFKQQKIGCSDAFYIYKCNALKSINLIFC